MTRINTRLDPLQLKDLRGFLFAAPREINLAKTRTLRKVVKSVSGELASRLAGENNMPVSIFRNSKSSRRGFRVRQSPIANGSTYAQIWSGIDRVKAAYIGKPAQRKKGAAAGRRRFYEKAFVAMMRSGHVGIFKRKTSDRTPIVEIDEVIKSVSVDDLHAQIPGRLIKTMDQELNYILHVAKRNN